MEIRQERVYHLELKPWSHEQARFSSIRLQHPLQSRCFKRTNHRGTDGHNLSSTRFRALDCAHGGRSDFHPFRLHAMLFEAYYGDWLERPYANMQVDRRQLDVWISQLA